MNEQEKKAYEAIAGRRRAQESPDRVVTKTGFVEKNEAPRAFNLFSFLKGDQPGHPFRGNQYASGNSGAAKETHELLGGLGFTPYSHSDNSQGYLNQSENKLPVGQMDAHLRAQGYRTAYTRDSGKPIVGESINGYKTWAYEKPGGPYQEQRASFDSKGGTHVRNVSISRNRVLD